MEHSSPLAAMQPPSVMFGHCFRSDVPSSYGGFGPRSGFNPNSFNFKDLSMKKGDYFNMKPVRGSSPTASLAADLSQNFHIDQRFVGFSSALCSPFILFCSLSLSWSMTKNYADPKNSPQLATPRRSLFCNNLFGPGKGRGKS